MAEARISRATPDTTQRVVEVVRSIAEELHPRAGGFHCLHRDSSLERDAGLDSLSRMELLTRLEATFSRALPEEGVLGAEAIADLVRVIGPVALASQAAGEGPARLEPHGHPALSGEPVALRSAPGTVTELLVQLASEKPEHVAIRLLPDGETDEAITAGDLYEGAMHLAVRIRPAIEPGQPVAVMLPTGRPFLECFFGILFAGGVPVPLAPPARLSQIEDHLRRQVSILSNCRASLLITSREIVRVSRLAQLHLGSLERVVTTGELHRQAAARLEEPSPVSPAGLALLQYTSGSTGDPKGVMLTHRNLLANVAAIAERLETGPDDVYVSWLPLYHDMGLIGGVLHALFCRIPLVLLPPQVFLARPIRWLRAIDRFGGTMTVAPNFAYEICHRRLTEDDLAGLDLSRLRLTLNGAEPVSAGTIEGFTRRFEPHGYREDAMAPCYGLAENTLAVSCARMFRRPLVETIDRDLLLREERAVPVADQEDAVRVVGCGPLMRGVEARVVDRTGHEVGERRIGRIVFRGSSATAGYYRNPEATRGLFDGGWRDSGDLGYVSGGEVFITGRAKDLVIRAGLNIAPAALEEAIGGIEGVRRGCVAVFGTRDRSLGSERLVVAAETRIRGAEGKTALESAIKEASIASVGIAPDEIALLAPRSLLKTSSGKLRRAACRKLFERGDLGRSSRWTVWRQLGRVWLAGLGSLARRATRRVGRALFTVWAWAWAGVLLAFIWLGVAVAPRTAGRHAWARALCGLFFRLVGPFRVEGRENLPEAGPFVVASNHASYVDSMALFAALSRDLAFAAKREFDEHPITRVLMRRLGTVFIDRGESGGASAAVERLCDEAELRGLAVFVEGTFVREPGLRPFRLGAFRVATDMGCPIVPVVIRGSRKLLRDAQWQFRPSAITVEILPAVHPQGEGFSAAVSLRDEVRERMLAVLPEPDLAVARDPGEAPIREAERWVADDRVVAGSEA
jgi:1-acyl-sn-glycerol-3-phosphate acyltransferase